MAPTDPLKVRKRQLMDGESGRSVLPSNEIDLVAGAAILYSSEAPQHPIEHLLDGRSGRGATRWVGSRPNTMEEIIIEFDHPERVRRVIFDAEEFEVERTQQITLEYSTDGGHSYHARLLQDYTFSPQGSTYQREDLVVDLAGVTHIRIVIVPNKTGAGSATLTSLRMFS